MFKYSYDIPKLPIPLTKDFTNYLIVNGAISKNNLEHDTWYYGRFRGTNLGKWDSKKQIFNYITIGFYVHWDECNHFEDDDNYAVFVPIRLASIVEINEELNKLLKK
jgi:hypothetical protein